MTHGTPAPLHLVPGEDLADGIRRILRLELDRLLATIDADAVDDDETVHEVRRTAKRLRAVVRLVRDGAPDVHRDANATLRDAARLVAGVRDAAVVAATAAALSDATDAPTAGVGAVAAALAARRDAADEAVAAGLEEAREQLATMRWQLDGWDLPDGPATDVLFAGHERTHRRAAEGFRRAVAKPTTERWHEWRKRVKYDRHQTEVLVAAWPVVLEQRADLLHDLSDLLGEDHDLAVLAATLRDLEADADDLDTALALVTRQRAVKQHAAMTLGARLYALPTDEHVAQLRTWWDRTAEEQAAAAARGDDPLPPLVEDT